ncbi:MAG: P-loop NTPase fold protein [Thermoguttaceae bacterium]
MSDSDQNIGLPTEEELQKLSRPACVAYAAMAARMVQPLGSVWGEDKLPIGYIATVDQAISVAEEYAEKGVANAVADAATAANVNANLAADAYVSCAYAAGTDARTEAAATADVAYAAYGAAYAANTNADAANAGVYTAGNAVAAAYAYANIRKALRKIYETLLNLSSNKKTINFDDLQLWPENKCPDWFIMALKKNRALQEYWKENNLNPWNMLDIAKGKSKKTRWVSLKPLSDEPTVPQPSEPESEPADSEQGIDSSSTPETPTPVEIGTKAIITSKSDEFVDTGEPSLTELPTGEELKKLSLPAYVACAAMIARMVQPLGKGTHEYKLPTGYIEAVDNAIRAAEEYAKKDIIEITTDAIAEASQAASDAARNAAANVINKIDTPIPSIITNADAGIAYAAADLAANASEVAFFAKKNAYYADISYVGESTATISNFSAGTKADDIRKSLRKIYKTLLNFSSDKTTINFADLQLWPENNCPDWFINALTTNTKLQEYWEENGLNPWGMLDIAKGKTTETRWEPFKPTSPATNNDIKEVLPSAKSIQSGTQAGIQCVNDYSMKPCLHIGEIADAIADVLDDSEKSICFGLFGRWGRGKTYLAKQVAKRLEKKNYATIEYNAWKYRTTPESWAFLYETFANKLRKTSWFAIVYAGVLRHGLWPLIFGLFLIAVPGIIDLVTATNIENCSVSNQGTVISQKLESNKNNYITPGKKNATKHLATCNSTCHSPKQLPDDKKACGQKQSNWGISQQIVLKYYPIILMSNPQTDRWQFIINILKALSILTGTGFVTRFMFRSFANFRKYFVLPDHHDKLGLQAIIGDDFSAMIRAWIPSNPKTLSKSYTVIICTILVFAAVWSAAGYALMGVSGQLASNMYGFIICCVFSAMILGVSFIPFALFVNEIPCINKIFQWPWYKTKRLLLIVDDLDRCESDNILEIIESIQLLCRENDLGDRLQVCILIEERTLSKKLEEKYHSLLPSLEGVNKAGNLRKYRKTVKQLVSDNIEKIFDAHICLDKIPEGDLPKLFEGMILPQDVKYNFDRAESIVKEGYTQHSETIAEKGDIEPDNQDNLAEEELPSVIHTHDGSPTPVLLPEKDDEDEEDKENEEDDGEDKDNKDDAESINTRITADEKSLITYLANQKFKFPDGYWTPRAVQYVTKQYQLARTIWAKVKDVMPKYKDKKDITEKEILQIIYSILNKRNPITQLKAPSDIDLVLVEIINMVIWDFDEVVL